MVGFSVVLLGALLVLGDPATWAGTGVLLAAAVTLAVLDRQPVESDEPTDSEAFQLLSSELSLGSGRSASRGGAGPGPPSVLRCPTCSQALTAAGDRDVVVMTVRVLGVDVEDDATIDPRPTPAEQLLLSQVVALAERQNRAVRLLIVPARDVFDAIATAMHRLRSSEVHVGESTTLSADEQARLLGEAWERLELEQALDVRLVIHHPSGRADVFYLGAHAPALSSRDLDLIHRLWLDAAKAVGPHVHHHDVVRAALTQMEQQLSGPEREQALEAIRRVARPADELAAVVRQRDFSQLRDMIRNRPPSDLAEVLTHLSVEDQVVVVPPAAAKGRRRHVRIPLARRAGAPAQGDGPGRRRGAAERHGARRSHDVPRGAARDRHAAAAGAAHAAGARGRVDAARLSRKDRSGG